MGAAGTDQTRVVATCIEVLVKPTLCSRRSKLRDVCRYSIPSRTRGEMSLSSRKAMPDDALTSAPLEELLTLAHGGSAQAQHELTKRAETMAVAAFGASLRPDESSLVGPHSVDVFFERINGALATLAATPRAFESTLESVVREVEAQFVDFRRAWQAVELSVREEVGVLDAARVLYETADAVHERVRHTLFQHWLEIGVPRMDKTSGGYELVPPLSARAATRPAHWLLAALFAAHHDGEEWALGPILFLLGPMIDGAIPKWFGDPDTLRIGLCDVILRNVDPARADKTDKYIIRTARLLAKKLAEQVGRKQLLSGIEQGRWLADDWEGANRLLKLNWRLNPPHQALIFARRHSSGNRRPSADPKAVDIAGEYGPMTLRQARSHWIDTYSFASGIPRPLVVALCEELDKKLAQPVYKVLANGTYPADLALKPCGDVITDELALGKLESAKTSEWIFGAKRRLAAHLAHELVQPRVTALMGTPHLLEALVSAFLDPLRYTCAQLLKRRRLDVARLVDKFRLGYIAKTASSNPKFRAMCDPLYRQLRQTVAVARPVAAFPPDLALRWFGATCLDDYDPPEAREWTLMEWSSAATKRAQ